MSARGRARRERPRSQRDERVHRDRKNDISWGLGILGFGALAFGAGRFTAPDANCQQMLIQRQNDLILCETRLNS